MSYVLKLSGLEPALYIAVVGGLIIKEPTKTAALQFARITDAQAFQALVVEPTDIETVA